MKRIEDELKGLNDEFKEMSKKVGNSKKYLLEQKKKRCQPFGNFIKKNNVKN